MTPPRFGGIIAMMLAVGLSLPGAGLSRASTATPLVAIQYEAKTASLVHVDPVTLERVDDAAVSIPRDAGGLTLSPNATEAAFGSNGTTIIHLYDLARMTAGPSFDVARGPGSVWIVAWPTRDRLLAVVHACCGRRSSVESIDPQTGQVIRRTPIKGEVGATSATADGAILLVSRPKAIGAARVLLVDADGRVRSLNVARVQVGVKWKGSTGRGRWVQPGLAVDAADARAFLVQAKGPTAVIDLRDLSVTYHAITSAARTLTRAEKELEGPSRQAEYIGDGLLAVSGFDGVRSAGGFSFVASGLMLVDTRDWSARMIDSASSSFAFAAPLLLVLHDQSFGAYSRRGTLEFQVKIEQPLGGFEALGPYAYVWLSDGRIDVIDLASHTLVNTTTAKTLYPIALVPQS